MHAALITALLLGSLSAVAVVVSRRRRSRRPPAGHSPAGWRPSRRQRRLLEELDRTLGADPAPTPSAPDWSLWPHRTAIEQIAADLRRLNRQRLGVAKRSVMWRKAILGAYDDRLRMASRCLGVVEYLDGLDGADRDLERIRVEGELRAAGLDLRATTAYPHHRQL